MRLSDISFLHTAQGCYDCKSWRLQLDRAFRAAVELNLEREF